VRFLYNLAVLTLLVIIQGTLLTVLVPWLPLAPAFIYLAILSLRLERPYLLAAALWTGLAQDILVGEMLGLTMLTNFVAMTIIWELKEEYLDNAVLTCGLRIAVATLVQELIIAFIYYIRGLESGSLVQVLQINAGINLLSNLSLYILFMVWLKIRGAGKVAAVLGAKR